MHEFKLYVSYENPNTTVIIDNLRVILNEEFHDDYNLEIMDVCKNPDFAQKDDVLVTPTIIKTSPSPVKKVVGDLSDKRSVFYNLGLTPDGEENIKTEKE